MIYTTLDTDALEIRLLQIQPSVHSEKLLCTLETVSLRDPPTYDALSYCWGALELSHTITVNGVDVKVTRSLEEALRALRTQGHTLVWVDALCINQLDIIERSRQIARMSTIYRVAERVIAWLGKEDEDSPKVVVLLKAFREAKRQLVRDDAMSLSSVGSDELSDMDGPKSSGDHPGSNRGQADHENPVGEPKADGEMDLARRPQRDNDVLSWRRHNTKATTDDMYDSSASDYVTSDDTDDDDDGEDYRESSEDDDSSDSSNDKDYDDDSLADSSVQSENDECDMFAADTSSLIFRRIQKVLEDKDFTIDSCIVALKQFLQRPYWQRVWIIQELAMGRDVFIYWGKNAVTWQTFSSVVKNLNKAKKLSGPGVRSIYNLSTFNDDVTISKSVNLLDALTRTTHALATDEHDKIYGIFGLAYDAQLYDPVPNYQQSVREMCLSMTKQLIRNTKSLDVVPLLSGSSSQHAHSLPSWSPYWTALEVKNRQRQIHYLIGSSRFWIYAYSESEDLGPWAGDDFLRAGKDGRPVNRCRATRKVKPTVRFTNDVLNAVGHKLATIEQISATSDPESKAFVEKPGREVQPDKRKHTSKHDKELFMEIYCLFSYRSPKEWKEMSFEDCIGCLSALLNGSKPESNFSKQYHFVFQWLRKHESFLIRGRQLRNWVPGLATDRKGKSPRGKNRSMVKQGADQKMERSKNLVHGLAKPLRDHLRLMIGKGGKIGWVVDDARPGDHLFLLKGCSVVVILRKRDGGGYSVVGDAFVQGVMDGIYVLDLDDDYDWKEIEIR